MGQVEVERGTERTRIVRSAGRLCLQDSWEPGEPSLPSRPALGLGGLAGLAKPEIQLLQGVLDGNE
jgi:hypothetical protein